MSSPKKTFLVVRDEANEKPTIHVRARDFIAKESAARDAVIQHYGLTMAPWGAIALLFVGLVGGLVAEDFAKFLTTGWRHSPAAYAIAVLNLGFGSTLVYVVGLVFVRSVKPSPRRPFVTEG